MDKIVLDNYLKAYTIPPVNYVFPSSWYETQSLTLRAPDEQILAWHFSAGWYIVNTSGVGASATYVMERRKLKSEDALDDLYIEYTNEVNNGKAINEDRYDSLVALYAASLDKTEDQLNSLETDEDTFEFLITSLIYRLESEYNTHNTDVSGDLDDWGNAQRQAVDDRFDEGEAKIQSSLISNGLYNTNTWTAAQQARIRDEAIVDNELEDKIKERQLALKDRLYGLKVDIQTKILAARDRLMTLLHSQGNARTTLRNLVINHAAAFAERRDDKFPDVTAIGDIAAQLGASDTGGFTA